MKKIFRFILIKLGLKNAKAMDIELIPFDKSIERPSGRYLVRTESTHARTIRYLQANCQLHVKDMGKFETSVDVNNQIVTHISTHPVE